MKNLKYLMFGLAVVSVFFATQSHAYIFNPGSGGSSGSSTGFATGTVITVGSPLTIGGSQTSTISGTGSTSTISNLDGTLYVPYNFGTVGCAGSSTATDLGACLNAEYAALPSIGGQIDVPAGTWPYTTPINFSNQSVAKPVLLYCSSGGGFYGGGTILLYNATSGSAFSSNNIGYSGGGYGITNCGFNGPAGIGNVGSSVTTSTIGINLGGTGSQGTAGAFGFKMEGVHISGFGTGLYIGSNMSFMIFDSGAINKNGMDINSPALTGANGENMRITNSTIADCNSATGQSISAFCMDVQESGNVQWTLTNDSFDDAQIYSNQFGGTANVWNITDLHDEDPNTGQNCYDRILTQASAVGAQATVFNIKGGDMMEDITTGCPEFVSFGGKLILDSTTGDINNNVNVPDTAYAVPLNTSTVLSWTGLSNQGFNTGNSANTGFTNVLGTTPASIDGLEIGSSTPVYYATTSTFVCSSCGGGGIASSSPFSGGYNPVINFNGALTNSNIYQNLSIATSSIAFDAAGAWVGDSGVSSATTTITIGSGSNRMLVVATLTTSGTASTTSVTDNGTSMTLVTSTVVDSSRTLALYDIIAPPSGVNAIQINVSATQAVVQLGGVSYSGVLQSSTPDAVVTTTTSTSITSLTTSLTTIANNDWSVTVTRFSTGSNGNVAGASSTIRILSPAVNTSIADTNGPKSPAGLQSMTITNGNATGGAYSIMVAFAPAPAVTGTGDITISSNGTTTDLGVLVGLAGTSTLYSQCFKTLDHSTSSIVFNWIYSSSTTLIDTATKPNFCQ